MKIVLCTGIGLVAILAGLAVVVGAAFGLVFVEKKYATAGKYIGRIGRALYWAGISFVVAVLIGELLYRAHEVGCKVVKLF